MLQILTVAFYKCGTYLASGGTDAKIKLSKILPSEILLPEAKDMGSPPPQSGSFELLRELDVGSVCMACDF